MDTFLESQGLWRKHIPRDSCCLFRAVSEQIFYSQTYHLKVRQECVSHLTENRSTYEEFIDGDYEEYLNNLSNPKVCAGLVEMSVLAILYRRDFVVYQDVGQPPAQLTNNNFGKMIILCYSNGNHYDLVYRKEYLDILAYCQAFVYGILYKDVFKLGADVDYAVQKMLYDKAYSKKKKILALPYYRMSEERREKCRIKEIDEEVNEKEGSSSEVRNMLARGFPPFPYKVAKALAPGLYRNVEFDHWNQLRKEQERAEQLVVPDFAPGVKCLVRLMENQMFHAHIQEMSPDHGPVTVFIEELGEKKIIPFEHLQPLAIPVYKALAMQGFGCKKSLRVLDGYFKNSSIMSLSTFVADEFRSSKRFLKKRSKGIPFLMPVSEKQAVYWSKSSTTTTTCSSPTAVTKQSPSRYQTEKAKLMPSTGNKDIQPIKISIPDSSPEGVSLHLGSPHIQTSSPGPSSTLFLNPQLMSHAAAPSSTLPPSPLPPFFTGNSLPFLPYTFMGPFQGNGGPGTSMADFALNNMFCQSGMTVDALGNPFCCALGTCELPYFISTMEPCPSTSQSNCIMGSTNAGGAEAGVQINTGVPPPPTHSGSFWTYNGSFTYLSTPTPGTAMGNETWDWTIVDEAPPGFQSMSPGVPLFFYVPPPSPMTNPMVPGVMTPPPNATAYVPPSVSSN